MGGLAWALGIVSPLDLAVRKEAFAEDIVLHDPPKAVVVWLLVIFVAIGFFKQGSEDFCVLSSAELSCRGVELVVPHEVVGVVGLADVFDPVTVKVAHKDQCVGDLNNVIASAHAHFLEGVF